MPPSILSVIADNQALLDAVKAEILKQFDLPSDFLGADTVSDNQLGQFLRARLSGVKAVENAFREIARYKTKDTGHSSRNPAR